MVNKALRLIICPIFVLFIILLSGFFESDVHAASGISVIVDGQKVNFTQEPVIKDGRALVPLRSIFEAMGMKIEWNSVTKSVIAQKGVAYIKLQIGNKTASVGTEELGSIDTTIDVEPQIINSSTMVPIRFIGEVSGANVMWDKTTKTVTVDTKTDRYFGVKKFEYDTYQLSIPVPITPAVRS